MAKTTNPIEDQYWQQIWHDHDAAGELTRHITHENAIIKLKVLLLALALLLFFSIPFIPGSLLHPDLAGRYATLAEFFTFEGYRLDVRGVQVNFTPGDYLTLCQFIYKWLGFASAACLIYWVFFINPFDKLRGTNVRTYIQDVVYEDPKHPAIFIKKTLDDERYRWAGFFYMWCVGYLICTLVQSPQWDWISQHQLYWQTKSPTVVWASTPLALIMLLVVNVVFAIVIGLAKPTSRAGSMKKMAALAVISACLFVTVILAVLNATVVQDYVSNYQKYTYPENLFNTGTSYNVNYHAMFWTAGMIISAFGAWLFPLCCMTYQNVYFRKIIDGAYKEVIYPQECPWECNSLRQRHDDDIKKRRFIRNFSAFELCFFFGLVLVALWGLYFYWGSRAGNHTVQNIGIGIMTFEVIWAILLSPIVHYKLEKSILYQGKGVAWVLSEDRGIGSWKKYYQTWFTKKSRSIPPEERAKLLPARRFMTVLGLVFALWGCGEGMSEKAVIDVVRGWIKVDASTIVAVFAIAYMIIAPILLLYSLKILRFTDPADPDRGKKRIYSILFLIFLAGLILGIGDVINKYGIQLEALFTSVSSTDVLKAAGLAAGILTLLVFLLTIGCFPIFVRIDDLFKSIPDLLKIMFFGVILLPTWNYLCEWFFTTPRMHWSWLSGPTQDPVYLRDQFSIGHFITGVGGYFYWGWVQEMLFLGYFAWLLYKIQPNKYINAAISSLLFMMFHWDNIALMIGTAVGGFFWAMWWGERRNLFMLGWMHGFNGTLVSQIIPMSMSVGPGVHS